MSNFSLSLTVWTLINEESIVATSYWVERWVCSRKINTLEKKPKSNCVNIWNSDQIIMSNICLSKKKMFSKKTLT